MEFNFDVLTIGTATRDVFLQSELFRAVKDEHFNSQNGFPAGEAECFALGSKIEIGTPVFTTGGGATNAAVTFARQGLKTAAAISLGKDESAKVILAELKQEGIKPLARRAKDVATAYSTIMLSSNGERTVLVYRGAADLVKGVSTKKIKPKWVYIAPGGIEIKKIKKIVSRFKLSGAQLVMNPSGFYIKQGIKILASIFDQLDVVILNREEASFLTGVVHEDVNGIFKKMDELVKGIVVVTDGPRGVMISDGKNLYKAGIFKEEKLVDRTGAGDAFGSGFVAGLFIKALKHESPATDFKNIEGGIPLRRDMKTIYDEEQIKYAIRLGSANATSVVEKIGAKAGILRKDEFEKNERWQKLEIKVETLV